MARPNGSALTRPNQLSDELHECLQSLIVEAVAGDDEAMRWLKSTFVGHDLHIERLLQPLTVEAQIDAYGEYCDGLRRRLGVAQAKAARLADQLHRQKHAHLSADLDAILRERDLARHKAEQERARLQAEQERPAMEAKRKLEAVAGEAREYTEMMFGVR